MHSDDLKNYIIERGENIAEVKDILVSTALEFAYSYSNNQMTEHVVLPFDYTIACYGIYRQLNSGSTLNYTGYEIQQNGYSYKMENDIPYNSRKILDKYKVIRCF